MARVERTICCLAGKNFNDGVGKVRLPNEIRLRVQKTPILESSNNRTRSLAAKSATSPFITRTDISHREAVQKRCRMVMPLRPSVRSWTVSAK